MRSSNLISRQIARQSKRQKQHIAVPPAERPGGAAAKTADDDRDSIEHLLTEWQRERPDLDPWALGVFGRVRRISLDIVRRAEGWLQPLGLTFESFSVIVTLRRSGAPYELNPTALYRDSLLSSGAITNRIDRVESAGLVKRRPDPKDRRGIIVQLTPKGRALADRAIALHFAGMRAALDGLNAGERKLLTLLLAKLLASVEAQDQPPKRRRYGQPQATGASAKAGRTDQRNRHKT
jgi:DNA-binding MarR family transcriptional regulator